MRTLSIITMTAALLSSAGSVFADDKPATKDEAVTMVKKAVAHYKAVGREKAFADFNRKGGPFTDRDLYVFVSSFEGRNLAHGANEKMIGRDFMNLKDIDGKPFVQQQIDQAKAGKAGWTDYKWPNPVTKEVEEKTSYCEPLESMAICAGVHKPKA